MGLGANLGQPLPWLTRASELIGALAEITGYSSVYRSAAHGFRQQPDFYNAAIVLHWGGSPAALVAELLAVERTLGRRRTQPGGPRTIDLDLLWVDGTSVERRDATVPHPRLLQRAFALVPMCEVAPDARDPRSGRPYASAMAHVRGQSLHRVAASHPWGSPVPSMDTKPRGW